MKRFLGAWALFASMAMTAHAQVAVIVSQSSTGADRAGNIFSAMLQKSIEDTGRYTMVSAKEGPAFHLQVKTMGLDELTVSTIGKAVPVSMYTVLLTVRNEDETHTYMGDWAGYCGDERAIDMSKTIGKAVVDAMDPLVKAIRDTEKKPSKM